MKFTLNPYLIFNGHAAEAMKFYQSVLGGNLMMQTYGEAGVAKSTEEKNRIIHASLTNGAMVIMGSDAPASMNVPPGENVKLNINGTDEKKLTGYFLKLSEGGKISQPLTKQFWGDTFGMLTDKYSINWMFNISSDNEMTLIRVFKAPVAKVWSAWTEPELVKQWWGPKIFTAPVVKIDFRVGGKYLYSMQSDQGIELWKKGIYSGGEYKEIVPMKKIVCTDHFADADGNMISPTVYGFPESFPRETEVTFTFVEKDGHTTMTLHRVGIKDEEETMRADERQGWNESFDKLDKLL